MAAQISDDTAANEQVLRNYARTLNEKDRRRFAAVEAKQRGRGGVAYIARVLNCSERTISRGLVELDSLENDPAAGRVRRPGGGRKKDHSELSR